MGAGRLPLDRGITYHVRPHHARNLTIAWAENSSGLRDHALDLGDIIQSIYDRANKLYGTNYKPDIK